MTASKTKTVTKTYTREETIEWKCDWCDKLFTDNDGHNGLEHIRIPFHRGDCADCYEIAVFTGDICFDCAGKLPLKFKDWDYV